MPVLGEALSAASSAAEQAKQQRRPRAQLSHPVQETPDPTPPARPNKPTLSSLVLEPTPSPTTKKTHFSPAAKLRGLGCTAAASQQVSVPAVIRSSADWERRKAKKKQKKGFLQKNRARSQGMLTDGSNFSCNSSASCVVAEDAWCGPGIGFSAADADCVVVVGRRNAAAVAASRSQIDGERLAHRERACFPPRRTINTDHLGLLDSDHSFMGPRLGSSDLFGSGPRHHRHGRPPSPEGLAEIVMLHSGSMLMGGRLDLSDRYRSWRLDVDNMSYEEEICLNLALQLLELGDKIGYVNTGLKDDEIACCIRKIYLTSLTDLPLHFTAKTGGKCSICQEEYEEDDELGKLECGHGFHLECIRQWLSQKNTCPICKTEAMART